MEYNGIAIGNRAFEARKAKNLKQSEISAAIGIAQSSYSRFELGQFDIPISKIIMICEILDVSLSWLVGEDSIPDLTDSERLEVEKYIRYIKSIRDKK